jgi:hypothetical protein
MTEDEELETVARTVHGANCEYNAGLKDPAPDPPWSALPQWHKDMIKARVRRIREAFAAHSRACSRDMYGEEIAELAAIIHQDWADYMTKEKGWELGEKKDPGATPPTHHCLKNWYHLPLAQQRKDTMAIAITAALTEGS